MQHLRIPHRIGPDIVITMVDVWPVPKCRNQKYTLLQFFKVTSQSANFGPDQNMHRDNQKKYPTGQRNVAKKVFKPYLRYYATLKKITTILGGQTGP